jgi:hypothetical protein
MEPGSRAPKDRRVCNRSAALPHKWAVLAEAACSDALRASPVVHSVPSYLSSMANLTIKVDDETLRRARIKALQEGTSVSRVLADYLDHFVEGDLQQSGWAAFLASARSTTAASEHGRDWTRDELYRG